MQDGAIKFPWEKTPLVYSGSLSATLSCDVYLKLEVYVVTYLAFYDAH